MEQQQPHVIPDNVLLHLYTRFILNLSEEIKRECTKNFVRIFFEVERAHWFYVDYCIEDPSVGGVDMFGLTQQLFKKFPYIVPKGINWQEKFIEWRKYRGSTCTGSVIIIDEHYKMILLVQGFYGNRWSLPGGKVNQNESLVDCAAREVMEETGLDLGNRISPSLYIDRHIGGTLRRAFIVEGLPRTSRLKPGTKNEIEAITWFEVADLPMHIEDTATMEKLNSKPNNFFLVMPFILQLKFYIDQRLLGKSSADALTESQRLCGISVNECPSFPQNSIVNSLNLKVNATTTAFKKKRKKKKSTSRSYNNSLSEDGEKSRDQKSCNNVSATANVKLFFLSIMDTKTPNIQNTRNNNVSTNDATELQLATCWQSLQLDNNKLLKCLCGDKIRLNSK
uniref:mRNA-decapping enzyme 2 n=1 Tax=Trichobilharzia regenti TaxID=157069 RepID=A0AA85JEW5_TRIRE|nr:unnamed protein product [Trichobilharzia regenti]